MYYGFVRLNIRECPVGFGVLDWQMIQWNWFLVDFLNCYLIGHFDRYVIGCAYGISDVLRLLWSEIEKLTSIAMHVYTCTIFMLGEVMLGECTCYNWVWFVDFVLNNIVNDNRYLKLVNKVLVERLSMCYACMCM